MTTIRSDWKQFDKELLRLKEVPTKAKIYLDAVLEGGFKATQAQVHILTGSLKLSGKRDTKVEGDQWIGVIEYGGASLGINNPVTYAIYEKARDGDHDFFLPLKALDSLYVKAILKALSK